ncbi:MAG: polysaccharide biosynthesis protein [Rhodobacteraceae bacterium]|nr:polysaccharide biosynthesis protein [Paracoccaceae bacterium]MAY47674.1 polysaccharide biosynthesis protein [Paracoccaceae bacterium]
MLNLLREIRHGDGTRARSMRSAAFLVIGFGGQNVVRLGGNLILTRLLFPEAFGLMALVQIFLMGLQMFSDVGIQTSIVRDPRGEERAFRDAAWTLQIIRGLVLWIFSCIVAWPAAGIYGEPQLLQLIPAAGLTALITGFRPTKVALANRHLQIGAQVMSELIGQVLGLVLTIALAYLWRDVWSLVAGGVLGAVLTVLLQRRLLPGENDRLAWDPETLWSIFHFGKFIFLSSIAGFIANQGERAILGGYVTLEQLGIYSVGFLMANLPLRLVQAADTKIGLPVYRKFLDLSVPENKQKAFRVRRMVVSGGIAISSIMAFLSVPMINFLYDTRYAMSGPILLLVSVSMILRIAVSNYDGAYMAHGDSRSHFHLTWVIALVQTGLLLLGTSQFGILGATLAPGLTMILTYPMRVAILRRYHAWDPVVDITSALAGLSVVALSIWLWRDAMGELLDWVF